jgi:hypothetical protein
MNVTTTPTEGQTVTYRVRGGDRLCTGTVIAVLGATLMITGTTLGGHPTVHPVKIPHLV